MYLQAKSVVSDKKLAFSVCSKKSGCCHVVNLHLQSAVLLTEQKPVPRDVKAFPRRERLWFGSSAVEQRFLFWEGQAVWGGGVGRADMLPSWLGPTWSWELQGCCSATSSPSLCSAFQQLRRTSVGSGGETWGNHGETGKQNPGEGLHME